MARIAWSDDENDLIIATYFAMLQLELAGRPYSKSAYNNDLHRKLKRSHGSIEFKLQNISAVLKGLGQPWIKGYKPADNFQKSLRPAVERWFASHSRSYIKFEPSDIQDFLEEPTPEWSGPPTKVSPNKPLETSRSQKPVVRKVDYAARDAANRDLGLAGEKLVFEKEKAVLRKAGRVDLAAQVRHVSEEEGDGLGYDILSYTPDGVERLVEVKTTGGDQKTAFYISRNELEVAKQHPDTWCLVRVWDFPQAPKMFELKYPLDKYVNLTPTNYLASF